ncbi:MAG: transporter permease [Marmoricola sp.]|jgi:ABC-2 type transport system permease protein|nr:transporter permease [Marmoricola sp.]
MSGTMSAPPMYGDKLDVSKTKPISMWTLVKVEMRKMIDTKAGMWLLIAIGLITAAIVVIMLLAANASDHTFINFMGATGAPQGFLLPVLGILLVTQEWGQRTGMVTFTLVPHRGQVLWSKVFAALLFGIAAVFVAMIIAALATSIGGSSDGWANVGLDDVFKYGMLQVSSVLGGMAFGLLFLNSAGAIVVSFVLPIAISIVSGLWHALSKIQAWIDLGTSQMPLFNGDHMTGKEWSQLAVGTVIWVVIPFAVGMWRVMRAEVK